MLQYKDRENSASLDTRQQQWTERGELQNRRLQVRFLSQLPERPEIMGITAPPPQSAVYALTPFCPQCHTTKSSTADL
jgi:hypothetical protein